MSTLPEEIFLKDYSTPNYWVEKIHLDVDIQKESTLVTATTEFYQNTEHSKSYITLDGIDLKLKTVWINDNELDQSDYVVTENQLTLKNLPEKFVLKTLVEIDPRLNLSGEGFYKSGDILCTQCEAEGFRRITYYLDRPDVMTIFSTKITACKKDYPILLSNGNKTESGELSENRHFVSWIDPHKKPAYLFAMVAGDLAFVKDTFITKSDKTVNLEIYIDQGNEDKCDHAMNSLKNSMKWEEEKFGLEYDLDIYMIVAVDSFNMGAMENKGLNIFNSSYVLAKKETATDSDYEGIEGVIGHEYFHNWTGNRVTCRDWFQLTLKEGLTVFRDQEFSSDMLSRSVKRIDDVRNLKARQFPEDAGPLSHPIKPKSYIEINNFYTSTIYEKGAEIIRMIDTLIGSENFRKGMDLYFERHDGHAVTTQDFISAMSDASGIDLGQFSVWYDQNGTPILHIESVYDDENNLLTIEIDQVSKLNNSDFSALHMPFCIKLYSYEGQLIDTNTDGMFEIKNEKTILKFENIDSKPILSLNCNFTAPVDIKYEYTQEELSVLMAYDQDDFNRYDAAQKLSEMEIMSIMEQSKLDEELNVSGAFLKSYGILLNDKEIDPAFKAYALSLPTVNDINGKSEKVDYDDLPKAIKFLRRELSQNLGDDLITTIFSLSQKGEYVFGAKEMGERALKNVCLDLLADGCSPTAIDLIYSHYQNSNNMTDEIGALGVLSKCDNPYREKALTHFYEKWKNETLVIQKWLRIQATAQDTNIEVLRKLENSEVYDFKIPNIFRSLITTFASANPINFNNVDGSGYEFIADQVLKVDKNNPQIAAGLCKTLNHLKKLDHTRASHLKVQLERILDCAGLSNDVIEVATKNLGK